MSPIQPQFKPDYWCSMFLWHSIQQQNYAASLPEIKICNLNLKIHYNLKPNFVKEAQYVSQNLSSWTCLFIEYCTFSTPILSFLILVTFTAMLVLHRYDNNKPSIHSFFIASGPLVKCGQGVQSFDTVDNYTLFSVVLSVTHEPNNGTFVSMRDCLKDPPAIT